jgi:hypothetical protein
MKTSFNKYLYIGFVVMGFVQLLTNHALTEAATQFGIALAFDPFDQSQPWKDRPTWQKVVLFIHLAVVACLFGYEVGGSDFAKGFIEGWNGVKK